MCTCVRACVRVPVCVGVWVWVCMCVGVWGGVDVYGGKVKQTLKAANNVPAYAALINAHFIHTM